MPSAYVYMYICVYIYIYNVIYIYIYSNFLYGCIYLKASPLPPAPFLLVAVWVVAGLDKMGVMFIDANIVRHSRNAVVNIIEKH